MRPKALLQRIIGARHIGEAITETQPRPVAARDLEKVLQGRGQGAGFVSMTFHGAEQTLHASFDLGLFALSVIGQQMSRPMYPLVGPLDVGP
jgi:hypothetical protein